MNFHLLDQLHLYCPTQNNWILQMNYDQIINHRNQKVLEHQANGIWAEVDSDSIKSPRDMMHIFFNHMTEERLIALVLTKSMQCLLIDNHVEITQEDSITTENTNTSTAGAVDDENENVIKLEATIPLPKIRDIRSTITIIAQHQDLVDRGVISRTLQKLIGIAKWANDWSKLVKTAPVPFRPLDLAMLVSDAEGFREWLRKWISSPRANNELSLSGHYYLNADHLQTLASSSVRSLVLKQNCQITSFEWLKRFSGLEAITIDQCQQIDENAFSEICKCCPNLTSVTIKYCLRVNVRIFLSLLKLDRLNKVEIDFPNFFCQLSPKDAIVSKDEWKTVCSYNLKSLFINSTNITLDVLDYIIKACPLLNTVYLDENILNMVSKNIVFDHEDINNNNTAAVEIINFHQASDARRGFKASRPMTFRNMFKNLITEPFSKSMINRINQLRTPTAMDGL